MLACACLTLTRWLLCADLELNKHGNFELMRKLVDARSSFLARSLSGLDSKTATPLEVETVELAYNNIMFA